MNFASVGTHHQPFQRLLDGLQSLDTSELVVQFGAGEPPAGILRAEPFMPFDQILDCYHNADKVIMHAGVGSILCARRAGHVPLVVPRRHDLGEHVDEHQAELAEALGSRGSVIPVWDIEDLAELLAAAPSREGGGESADPRLCEAVHTALAA